LALRKNLFQHIQKVIGKAVEKMRKFHRIRRAYRGEEGGPRRAVKGDPAFLRRE